MKIGIVCPYDIYRSGGVQEAVWAYLKEFKELGHDAKIIASISKNTPKKKDKDVLLIGKSVSWNSPLGTKVDISGTSKPKNIDDFLEKEQFDILHFHEPWVPLFPVQLLAKSKAKNVATMHAKLPEGKLGRTVEQTIKPYTKKTLKKLDYITAVSAESKRYVQKLTRKKVEIIPNGIDLEKYNPDKVKNSTNVSKKDKTILYIGRLEKRKGVEHLIRAYSLLVQAHPDVELVIVGDGDKKRQLKEIVRTEKLDKVKFLGFVSEAEKLSLLKSADLFCSPALFGESFGIVLLEAMAMDTPIVAGNNPGYTSVMVDEGEYSLINPKEASMFAHKLGEFLFDESIRKDFLKWSSKYVKQFSYKDLAKKYVKIYESLLK